jgi:hypothetical protein
MELQNGVWTPFTAVPKKDGSNLYTLSSGASGVIAIEVSSDGTNTKAVTLPQFTTAPFVENIVIARGYSVRATGVTVDMK